MNQLVHEGMPREELKSRLNMSSRAFDLVISRITDQKLIASSDKTLRTPDFRAELRLYDEQKVEPILRQFDREPFNSPSFQEVELSIGTEVLNALIAQKRLVRLNDQVLLPPEALRQVTDWVTEHINESGRLTAAELRDHLKTSRKYAIAILEYLDEKRVTKRVGDARVLG